MSSTTSPDKLRPATSADRQPAPSAAPLIELRHVSKSYATVDDGPQVTVVDGISLEVRAGELLALLGQSGSGKSTILRLMAGLTEPTHGSVLSHGEPLAGINPNLAIVFQSFALYPWLTVEENVQVGLIHRRLDDQEGRDEIERALQLIGLSGYENAYPKQLSGGMRQRVGIARAIVARPEVLCMDEAFSGLDVLTAENLRSEVVELWRSDQHDWLKSIFFVTHNIAEAAFMASRIVIISSHPGRVRQVIENPLPYPRDTNSREFAAMVDQIHAAITALVLPDEPVREAAAPSAAVAAAPAVAALAATRIESIPAAGVSEILGLLEILKDSEETINVFDLSARIAKEFGETIAIVKAAEMLGLVDTPKDDVRMTEVGWYFLAAPLPVRKTLFKQSIMKLRLFQILMELLDEAPNNRVSADDVLERLAALLPYERSDKLFETLIAWGRYAEILDYDQDTHTAYLPRHEEEDDEDDAEA